MFIKIKVLLFLLIKYLLFLRVNWSHGCKWRCHFCELCTCRLPSVEIIGIIVSKVTSKFGQSADLA